MKKRNLKRIGAILAIILLLALSVATLLAAVFDKSGRLFQACLVAMIGLPILLWIYIWLYGRLTGKHTMASFTPKKEIRTIIFDIGNVLTDFRWKEFFYDLGMDDAMLARIAKATVESEDWCEYDRGLLSDEEIIERFVQNDPGIEKELRESLQNLKGMVAPREYAIPWIKELKQKGYQVLYLSNFSHKAEVECADALTFLPYMDGGILSYKEKLIKPQPEIYQLLLDRYHLVPEECVFLDDTKQNLDAAEKFGIHTILFTDREQALSELKALGVE